VFDALNRLPEAQHGADIMRVRPAYLAGRGRNVRQTVLLASFASAELNALARRCANVAGAARLVPAYKARRCRGRVAHSAGHTACGGGWWVCARAGPAMCRRSRASAAPAAACRGALLSLN